MTTPHLFYGGTFDPVHLGHLQVARTIALRMDAPVLLVPAADPPHRPAPGASAQQRAHMLDLAVAGDPLLGVDRRELRRDAPSYTVDTLAALRAELGPSACIVWVLGVDSVLKLAHWHHWQRLLELANLLAVQRPLTQVGRAWLHANAPEVHAELAPRWTVLERLARRPAGGYAAIALRPLRRESASEVRVRIAQGKPWKALVPPAVASFIESAGLYGARAGAAGIIVPRHPPPIEGTR